MSTDTVTTTSRSRRTIAGIVAAAAIVGLGAGVSEAAHGTSASHSSNSALRPLQCWYQGWFEEGGVWYYGWFRENC